MKRASRHYRPGSVSALALLIVAGWHIWNPLQTNALEEEPAAPAASAETATPTPEAPSEAKEADADVAPPPIVTLATRPLPEQDPSAEHPDSAPDQSDNAASDIALSPELSAPVAHILDAEEEPIVPTQDPADPAPSTSEQAEESPPNTHHGAAIEGEVLARIRLRGSTDRATLQDWFANDLAALEVKTTAGTFLVVPEPANRGARISRPEHGQPSQARIRHAAALPLSLSSLDHALAARHGVSRREGSEVELVLTPIGQAAILAAQQRALDLLEAQNGTRPHPGELALELCFTANGAQIASIRTQAGSTITTPENCSNA